MMNFDKALQRTLDKCRNNDYPDNWDYRRYGTPSIKAQFKTTIKQFLTTLGLYKGRTLKQIQENRENLSWLHDHLLDRESKNLLVNLMAYRILGHRKVKLPLNTPAYWEKLAALDQQASSADDQLQLDFLGWHLSKLDLKAEGYPIQLYIRPSGVFMQLLLQQYRCELEDEVIEVASDDVIIDCGGCYGDTALYFAFKAAPNGEVYSYEFMPSNIEIFKKNLALNPLLAQNINIVKRAVWSTSGEKLYVKGNGPGARVTEQPLGDNSNEITTLSIDELVQENNLSKVDFIKMDIEGAELEALIGAQSAIKKYRPKLAISVYHNLHDFWTIPRWIDSLALGYHFTLRHFTIHAEETVLFAIADK